MAIDTSRFTRREFIGTTVAVAAVMVAPRAFAAGMMSDGSESIVRSAGRVHYVARETELVGGVMRYSAWNSMQGELCISADRIRIGLPMQGETEYSFTDLQFGHLHEIVRREFGDTVLQELLDEVEWRKVFI